jgi:hypothetical protein
MARTSIRKHSPQSPRPSSTARFQPSNNTANRAGYVQPAIAPTTPHISSTRYFQSVENGVGIFAPIAATAPTSGGPAAGTSSSKKRRSEKGEESKRSSKKAKSGNDSISPLSGRVAESERAVQGHEKSTSSRPRHPRRVRNNRKRVAQTQQRLSTSAENVPFHPSQIYVDEHDDPAIGLPDYEVYEQEAQLRERLLLPYLQTNGGNGRIVNNSSHHGSQHLEQLHLHSTASTSQHHDPPSSSEDNGLGHGIPGYPDPTPKKVWRHKSPSQELDDLLSATKEENDEDDLYEADGESTESPEPGSISNDETSSPERINIKESRDEVPHRSVRSELDLQFQQGYTSGLEEHHAEPQPEPEIANLREQIAAERRAHEEEITLIKQEIKQETEDERYRNWERDYGQGYGEGWGQGYREGQSSEETYYRGYTHGQEDGARRQCEANEIAQQEQARQHRHELEAVRERGRRQGLAQGRRGRQREMEEFLDRSARYIEEEEEAN